ncbi:UDP-2,3-diacylglucosamine diphosphatase [Mariniphaga sp.]|uniref:UDP-2,3-diacylglucosamine diphosphatase n=1 Tax=Mariniphaga sp. TaxID=1954475 RepID=UPI0035695E74
MEVRDLEVAVISDLHLATHASKPKKVLKYLKSILPNILVLNGDIIDSWRFSRNYFPKNQLKVVRQIIKMMEKGVQVYYITGNHDEFLRKFAPTTIGNLKIVNQLVLELDGMKTWIFHGDIFDSTIHRKKRLAKFGAALKGFLSVSNKLINHLLVYAGKNEIILYKSIKYRLIRDKLNLSSNESKILNAAITQDYQTVICGHTHVPKEKVLTVNDKTVRYLNCGDWVEHFTAAEFNDGNWRLYYHHEQAEELQPDELEIPEENHLFQIISKEFACLNLI